jgi:hypothetical protein
MSAHANTKTQPQVRAAACERIHESREAPAMRAIIVRNRNASEFKLINENGLCVATRSSYSSCKAVANEGPKYLVISAQREVAPLIFNGWRNANKIPRKVWFIV